MIEYRQGDLFMCDAEAIVNTVNCVGIMGRGIALQFKKQYPENFKHYEAACKRSDVVPGKMHVYETHRLMNPRLIINFPTKRHWRDASRIEDIENGLVDLVDVILQHDIKSIAIPPLGCGLGGLEWSKVKPCIESALTQLNDVKVMVFEPIDISLADTMQHNLAEPENDKRQGRAALVSFGKGYRMKESAAMLEIRKIRDENSLRRLSLTPAERKKELDETTEWFIKRMGKDIKIVNHEATTEDESAKIT